MRTSISITNYTAEGGTPAMAGCLRELARAADDAGIDTIWVADHLLQADPVAELDDPMLEAYTTLGFLAAASNRVRLGSMVTPVTFRPPALLLKAVTTIDVLTGGRAWLGLGAGYEGDEARAMGLPLPPMAERFEHLEDTLELAHRMRADDDSAFHGRRHVLDHPLHRPLPMAEPHLPIMIGGTGERRTLPLVARYADACNLFDIPDGGATVRHKLDVLHRLLDDIARPRDEVEVTISTALSPEEDAASFQGRCGEIAKLGIGHLVVITRGIPWSAEAVATVASAQGVGPD
jgi:F420-dependent oxidoreductase-like protein